MAGICGAVGDLDGVEKLIPALRRTGDEHVATFEDGTASVTSAVHPYDAGRCAAETDDGTVVRLWGSVWGFDGPDGYESVPGAGAAFCADRYERHGLDFVGGLNGSFAGVVYDPDGGRLSLFTDRLGTLPFYYAETGDGVVFSTDIQSVPLHPGVDAGFDVDYVGEYLTIRRVFGVKTPLSGVRRTHPASVTILTEDGDVKTEQYWMPRYDPVDRPRRHFVRRLARTFREVVGDRTDPETDYGLLLSGGSDSRLVLAALSSLGVPVRAYHLNEWRNVEAKAAARIADAAGAEFTFLRRDRDYQARALTSTPRIANFVGYFNQVHAAGFAERLREEVDVLLTGHYGDLLFRGAQISQPRMDLGPLGSFELPVERRVNDLPSLVANQTPASDPAYLELPRSVRKVYRDNVRREGDRVVNHGVAYPSLREAVVLSRYPLTNSNSQFFYYGTAQTLPTAAPFLDNRLVDLFLSTPMRHILRGDLVNGAVELLAPDLADVPHGGNVVPIRHPFALQYVARLGTDFARKHVLPDPSEPHWTHGPWTNHTELIRTHGFVRDAIDDNEGLIRSLPFLEWDGVEACYDDHLAGADNMGPLYSLVTFLEMPVVERIAGERE